MAISQSHVSVGHKILIVGMQIKLGDTHSGTIRHRFFHRHTGGGSTNAFNTIIAAVRARVSEHFLSLFKILSQVVPHRLQLNPVSEGRNGNVIVALDTQGTSLNSLDQMICHFSICDEIYFNEYQQVLVCQVLTHHI